MTDRITSETRFCFFSVPCHFSFFVSLLFFPAFFLMVSVHFGTRHRIRRWYDMVILRFRICEGIDMNTPILFSCSNLWVFRSRFAADAYIPSKKLQNSLHNETHSLRSLWLPLFTSDAFKLFVRLRNGLAIGKGAVLVLSFISMILFSVQTTSK